MKEALTLVLSKVKPPNETGTDMSNRAGGLVEKTH